MSPWREGRGCAVSRACHKWKKLYLHAATVQDQIAQPLHASASSYVRGSIGYQLHPKVGIPSTCTTPLTGLGPGTKTYPSSFSPNMLAPLCAAWREEPLRGEDANSKAWSDCASQRLLTSVPSAWAALLLVCAQVCLHAHPRTQVPLSVFLSPGKPATPPELLLHDGPLALWSAAPAGSLASAAHLALRVPLKPSTFLPPFTSILPGPSTLLGPPYQDPRNSRCQLLQGRRDHITHLMRHPGKFNIIILEGKPVLAWGQG